MPDRELRRMSRTELVEIIFALKQSEDQLKAENAALTAKLEDRQLHIENAGSIAQAALELNRVFEAAQAAADEYLTSVRAIAPAADTGALQAQAQMEAQQILAQAHTEADSLKAQAQQECQSMIEEAQRKRAQTEADCKALLDKTEKEVQSRWADFDRRASEVLDNYRKVDFLPEGEGTK